MISHFALSFRGNEKSSFLTSFLFLSSLTTCSFLSSLTVCHYIPRFALNDMQRGIEMTGRFLVSSHSFGMTGRFFWKQSAAQPYFETRTFSWQRFLSLCKPSLLETAKLQKRLATVLS
jgi:hypothetical protein